MLWPQPLLYPHVVRLTEVLPSVSLSHAPILLSTQTKVLLCSEQLDYTLKF